MSNKKSIRFFNDHEVRAVWDEENSKWWFSTTVIVRALDTTKKFNFKHELYKRFVAF